MKLESLQDLFVNELRDLYDAETRLIKVLPKMAKGAHSPELQSAFKEHLEQTKGHAERLERIFEKLNAKPAGKTCYAMKGLIEEGSEQLSEKAEPSVMDAGLICAAQKVEHYEIAGYGCVRSWAHQLGNHAAADLLEQTLYEEKETDERLNHIAEGMVNLQAAGAGRR